MGPTPNTEACQGSQALREAHAHIAAGEAADRLHQDIHLGLRQFADTFLDALAGDFLAESDERHLRDKYRDRPVHLRRQLARNSRTLSAQRALHILYNKLLAGTPLTPEERALAEHARDLCQTYATHETDRRTLRFSPSTLEGEGRGEG